MAAPRLILTTTFLMAVVLVKLKHRGEFHLDYNYSLLWCVNYIYFASPYTYGRVLAVPWCWHVLYASFAPLARRAWS